MATDLGAAYTSFYGARDPEHVYPVEFVVRAFLGRYPRLARPVRDYSGKSVLDLGFGDGRNLPLLANLGMRLHGIEIAEDICQRARRRLQRLGIDADLRVGRNNAIPYPDRSFDCLLACHSCYYIDRGTTFADNVAEIARVLKPGSTFVFSAPIGTSYIMAGATDLGDGLMQIANDPYGLRNGTILKKFDSPSELEAAIAPAFRHASVGACRNDFWGIEEHVWIVVCERT
jgi:SAM-dependent methyltransferase